MAERLVYGPSKYNTFHSFNVVHIVFIVVTPIKGRWWEYVCVCVCLLVGSYDEEYF